MASSIHWKIILLTACLCWSSCLSQNPEEDLLAFVREAVERIKDMAEKVEDLHGRLDGLKESQMAVQEKVEALQDGQELLRDQLVQLQESSQSENQLEIFGEILQLDRDLQRDIWNNSCTADHITELQTNVSTELQKIERSIEGCSSVEQQLSNLTMVLTKDDCAEGSHRCSPLAVCEEAIVSYRCICLPGTTGDGFTCEYVDECASVEDRCHEHAECRNIIGNYTCACNPGFDGDGFNCREVPSCVHPNFTIPGIKGCLVFVREYKTGLEASRHCSDGGERLVEGWYSNAQSELLSDYVDKELGSTSNNVWVGMNHRRWTEGKTDVPSVLFYYEDDLQDRSYGHLHTYYKRLFDDSGSSTLYFVCQRTSPPSSSSSSST